MKTNIRTLLAGLLLLGSMGAVAAADAQQAIAQAKAANDKAASLQGAWVSTGELIKAAEKAAAKGDTAAALKLAQQARHQGELAYAQAAQERKHWSPPPYLK